VGGNGCHVGTPQAKEAEVQHDGTDKPVSLLDEYCRRYEPGGIAAADEWRAGRAIRQREEARRYAALGRQLDQAGRSEYIAAPVPVPQKISNRDVINALRSDSILAREVLMDLMGERIGEAIAIATGGADE
jgi:hypothetical protein